MTKIAYRYKKLSPRSLRLVEIANTIIERYQAQGYDLTLRQLYYQMVASDLLPNRQEEYDKLGRVISDARLCGLVDWDAITDRTRNLRGVSHWDTPSSIMKSAAHSFRLDKWRPQPHRVEVWVEKDALVGVLERICTELDVDYFSCRGYTSQSEMHAAAQRLARYQRNHQKPVILHLGDHDPSGKDMTRDIDERLGLFLGGEQDPDLQLEVERIALNMDQITQYKPPPNPAKITDSRADEYISRYGESSWELDALEPQVISDLIRDTVEEYRDAELWEEMREQETAQRSQLSLIAARWSDVVTTLGA